MAASTAWGPATPGGMKNGGSQIQGRHCGTADCGDCPEGNTCNAYGFCETACDCNDGPCCDGCNLRPTSFICDQGVFRELVSLEGEGCGMPVYTRTLSGTCSGTSTDCDGPQIWNNVTQSIAFPPDLACRNGLDRCVTDDSCVEHAGNQGCGCSAFGGAAGSSLGTMMLLLAWIIFRRRY